MTIFLIILFFLLLPFAPVYMAATTQVKTQTGKKLGEITMVTHSNLFYALYIKFTSPIHIRIMLPFKEYPPLVIEAEEGK